MKIRYKILIYAGIVIAFALAVFAYWRFIESIKPSPQPETKDELTYGETTMQVDNQKFDLRYSTDRTSGVSTGTAIFCNKNYIFSYNVDSEFVKPEIKLMQDNADFKCYELSCLNYDAIIYKINNGKFKAFEGNCDGLTVYDSNHVKMIQKEKDTIYPVLKKLFMTKKFECINSYGYFLLIYGDQEVKECLERYSQLNYTDEELNINKNSYYNQSQIRVFADCDLSLYQKALQSSSKQLSSK